MHKNPSFSVIMPTLNRAFCIKTAIDSMLAQIYTNFELIIIDDGSTDSTDMLICENYPHELKSGRIVFYRFEEHVGVCKARNKGLELAKNNWIGYIDTDNKVVPEFLLTFANVIKTNKAKTYYAQSKLDIDGSILGKEFNHRELWLKNFIDMGNFVHSKTIVDRLGGFDENMTRVVDWELAVRYTKVYKPIFVEKILLHYNDSNNHTRITNSVDGKANWAYFFKKHMYPLLNKKKQNILGIIRYSCNCLNGYNINVLDEDYLDYRYKIFKEVTLKSLSSQTNKNFNIILLHSNNLSEHEKLKMLRLEHQYPFLTNVYLSDGMSISKAVSDSMGKLINPDRKNLVTFRLDNDDALSKDFIKNLKKYAKHNYQGKAITMPSICAVQRIGEDEYLYEARDYASNAIGLAYVSSPDEIKSVMDLGNHAKVAEIVPLIIDKTQGGLQTINGENCCNHIKDKEKAKKLTLEELNKKLSKHFPEMKFSCLKIIK